MDLKKLIKSFHFAFKGILKALASEQNMRVHFLLMLAVLLIGALLGLSRTEWCLCFLCFGIVIASEMTNTVFEKIANFISPERNAQIADIKDIASGMVFISAIVSAVIGSIIFIPKIIALF